MSGYARLVFCSIGLLLSFGANPLPAGLITFNVDLSGVDEFSGNTLRVFGTLTVDPDMPITVTSISSALYLQQKSNAPLPLPSNPHLVGQVSDNLAWVLLNNALFITRIGNEGSFITWEAPSFYTYAAFTLSSFGMSPELQFISWAPSNFAIDEVFLPGSQPARGTLLLGTIVPEPSSIFILSLNGTLIPLLRWRRC